jgi:hypothetical protein
MPVDLKELRIVDSLKEACPSRPAPRSMRERGCVGAHAMHAQRRPDSSRLASPRLHGGGFTAAYIAQGLALWRAAKPTARPSRSAR